MDGFSQIIGVTDGDLVGCENRRKSGTVGDLLNQSSDEPSTTKPRGESKASTTAALPPSGDTLPATSFSSGWLAW